MEFKHIPLAVIHANPENPRKTFDEIGLQELAQSIQEKGVLQPILVRQHPEITDHYQVVCGERRFRASQLAGVEDIPCTIRHLDDEEALEVMLMENFQRQDVHPIEEAIGFSALQSRNSMTPSQIAAKVGKSTQYVVSRLKLAKLIPTLHKPFYEGRFDMRTALAISVLAENAQSEWYDEQDPDDEDWSVDDWYLKNFHQDLKKASFDIEDKTLVKRAGACIGCQYNTASSSLFPDEADNPRCLNLSCFKSKSEAMLHQKIKDALASNLPILFSRHNRNSEFLEKATEGCLTFDLWNTHYEEEPDAFEFDETVEDYEGDEEEFEQARLEAEEAHKEEVENWERVKKDPSYQKGLKIDSDMEITEIYFYAKKDGGSSSNHSVKKVKVADVISAAQKGEATLLEKSLAVDQIKADIKNAKDMFQEKLFIETHNFYNDETNLDNDDAEELNHAFFMEEIDYTYLEMEAIAFVMLESLNDYSGNRTYFFSQMIGSEKFAAVKSELESFKKDDLKLEFMLQRTMEWIAKAPAENWLYITTCWFRMFVVNQIKPASGLREHNSGLMSRIFTDKFVVDHYSQSLKEVKAAHQEALDKKLRALDAKLTQLED